MVKHVKILQSAHFKKYRKIPKNKPQGLHFSKALFEGVIFGGAYIWRGFPTEGKLRFKIDWASRIVGSKNLPFLLCFTSYLRSIFQVQAPGGLILFWRGDLTEGFFRYRIGGLIFGGAYTWRGLFSEFYSNLSK